MAKRDRTPLAVDLDGTMLEVDSLLCLSLEALRHLDLTFPLAFLTGGRIGFKRRLASRWAASLDMARLPWSESAIKVIRAANERGADVWLVTGADKLMASRVARYFSASDRRVKFDGFKGTDAENMTGRTKAAWLVKKFGERGFDYMGNSRVDLHVWAKARTAYVAPSYARNIDRVRLVCDDVRLI